MTYMGIGAGAYAVVEAKTADYNMVPGDLGKTFTNRGAAGAVVLTMPPTADIVAGWHCSFFVVADQNVTVTTPTADTGVAFNDAAADSVAFSTTSEKIGGGGTVVWDGTGWLYFLNLGMDTQTPVVAT